CKDWLWTSHLAGGPPITNGEPPQAVDNSYGHIFSANPVHIPVSESVQIHQPLDNMYGNHHPELQKFSSMGRATDSKPKEKNSSQPIIRTSSPPIGILESQINSNSHQPGYMQANNNVTSYQGHHPQSVRPSNPSGTPTLAPGNFFSPNPHLRTPHFMPPMPDGYSTTSASLTYVPDIATGPDFQQSSSSALDTQSAAATGCGVWGTPGCPKPSEYVQGLKGVISLALSTPKK
ncbi:hypothetical protein Ccrd_020124, partial [Cynara cardunculus var. scolymus]